MEPPYLVERERILMLMAYAVLKGKPNAIKIVEDPSDTRPYGTVVVDTKELEELEKMLDEEENRNGCKDVYGCDQRAD